MQQGASKSISKIKDQENEERILIKKMYFVIYLYLYIYLEAYMIK